MKRLFSPCRAIMLAFGIVLSGLLVGLGGLAHAESVDDLKFQLQEMQKKMMEMQQSMQVMQDRINQLEAAPAPEAAPPPSEGNVWSKFDMRLYGKLKTDFNYDTAEFKRYNDYVGAVAAEQDHDNDSTNFNPRDTRFGFESTHQWDDWLAKGRFEMDFYGSTDGFSLIPRIRLAYVDVSNKSGTSVRVGQDWIPVAQLNPATVDFGILSAAGNLWYRVPQATVRQQFGDFELLASVMKHRRGDFNKDASGAAISGTENEDRMPWVLGRVAYTNEILGKGGLLALGGGYRHADYGTNNSENTDRWLVAGELKYIVGPVTLQGELWTGEGIGGSFIRTDLDISEDGAAAAAYGGWLDLTYALTEKTTVTAGYGFDNPNNNDIGTIFNDRRFTRNEQYYINTWYALSKPLKVGLEWIHLETERHEDVHTGNRFTASMQYLF